MDSFSAEGFLSWDEATRAASAAELRGELLQTLTAAAMDSAWLPPADREGPGRSAWQAQMLVLLQDAVACTERIATDLQPLMLDGAGTVTRLQFLASEHSRRTGAACELKMDGFLESDEEPFATGVFRIAQDWLRALRLDSVGDVRIKASRSDRGVTLQLRSGGARPGAANSALTQALAIVRERAHMLGGSVYLEAKPDATMQLDVRIPAQPRISA